MKKILPILVCFISIITTALAQDDNIGQRIVKIVRLEDSIFSYGDLHLGMNRQEINEHLQCTKESSLNWHLTCEGDKTYLLAFNGPALERFRVLYKASDEEIQNYIANISKQYGPPNVEERYVKRPFELDDPADLNSGSDSWKAAVPNRYAWSANQDSDDIGRELDVAIFQNKTDELKTLRITIFKTRLPVSKNVKTDMSSNVEKGVFSAIGAILLLCVGAFTRFWVAGLDSKNKSFGEKYIKPAILIIFGCLCVASLASQNGTVFGLETSGVFAATLIFALGGWYLSFHESRQI